MPDSKLQKDIELLLRITPRGAGHTTGIVRAAAATNGIIVSEDQSSTRFIQNLARELGIEVTVVAKSNLENLLGHNVARPIFLDNQTLDVLLQGCQAALEQDSSKHGVLQHMEHLRDLEKVKKALSPKNYDAPGTYKSLANLLGEKIDDLLKDLGISDLEEPPIAIGTRKNIRMMLLRKKGVTMYSNWKSLLTTLKEKIHDYES